MIYLLIGCDLIIIGISILKYHLIPSQLPLLYSQPWGEDQLVDWWMLFILPILMNLLYIINISVKRRLFPNNAFIDTIVQYFNIALIMSLTAIFIKILFLVT